jgi:thioesterase domain-containing protein
MDLEQSQLPEDSLAKLETYLHEHIPLSLAMGVTALESGEKHVLLGAPLAPNINHRETVFGGSASAVAILAGWALLHSRLRGAGLRPRLVIQRNTMEYKEPIVGDFQARAELAEELSWERFLKILDRRGKGRITVPVVLWCEGKVVARLTGEFVALNV